MNFSGLISKFSYFFLFSQRNESLKGFLNNLSFTRFADTTLLSELLASRVAFKYANHI